MTLSYYMILESRSYYLNRSIYSLVLLIEASHDRTDKRPFVIYIDCYFNTVNVFMLLLRDLTLLASTSNSDRKNYVLLLLLKIAPMDSRNISSSLFGKVMKMHAIKRLSIILINTIYLRIF